jgi:hypothetical protein
MKAYLLIAAYLSLQVSLMHLTFNRDAIASTEREYSSCTTDQDCADSIGYEDAEYKEGAK